MFAAIILLANTTFAAENNEPTLQVQREFNRMFTNSTGASWQEVSGLYKVMFMQSGQHLTAYYNSLGEFESVSRNITTDMLPLMLQGRLLDKLAYSWVSESFEVSGNNGTRYYVTIENADDKTLYFSNSADWSVYKKSQK